MTKIVALIPAYNEGERIAKTVESLKKVSSITRIVVVDDCSTDDTAKKASEAGAEVFGLEENMGKGGALNKALKGLDYDILLLIDGDLSESASEACKILEPVIDGSADMTIADFPKPDKKGGFGLVKGLARWGIWKLTGTQMNEPLSGQRAIRRNVIESINKFSGGFGVEVGMTIDALQKGFKVKEIPTSMSHAETGRDIRGFMHRGHQFLDVFKVILSRLR
ncbi:glycosyltransferase family 2 protein [Candidatus Oleimmundimicrobium sp.]|uniref:glycosyltransferase family 2 protein n=1 Tax=Candidatus Oleimmundimicrobium sp. TaxID=3060597 RepID=UPI0027263490|nr:glycosyltransferase family 2 protein [Candidatus Oleimmundimicrobium sp.]MDO8886529.1 glycosyltransferase family 2 protein [Candidatus Oleimmundimicrobium sp.]